MPVSAKFCMIGLDTQYPKNCQIGSAIVITSDPEVINMHLIAIPVVFSTFVSLKCHVASYFVVLGINAFCTNRVELTHRFRFLARASAFTCLVKNFKACILMKWRILTKLLSRISLDSKTKQNWRFQNQIKYASAKFYKSR